MSRIRIRLNSVVVSITCAAILLVTGIITLTAAIVRQAAIGSDKLTPRQARVALAIATWPGQVREVMRELPARLKGEPRELLMERAAVERPYWTRKFPAPEDEGYLLLSGVDPAVRSSSLRLLRISDGATMAEWRPNWDAIYSRITDKPGVPRGSVRNARAVHPLLMKNGDVVFNTSNALVRLSACSGDPVWVLDEVMHHSVELDSEGNLLVSGVSFSGEGFPENAWMTSRIRDDTIARVSPDGRLLENLSLIHILRSNGLEGLLLGTHGAQIEDPLHVNQIEEAGVSGPHWLKGDLLVSLRHLSTVLLFRPSTGAVVWHRTGPWLNQHNATFVGTHEIAVFDNHVVADVPGGFLSAEGRNHIIVMDLDTGMWREPFSGLLDRDRPATVTEGRFRLLADGGLFIEESDNGRHLRYGNGALMWSRVNDFDDSRIGNVAWSRYLTEGEVSDALSAIGSSCSGRRAAPAAVSR